MNAASVSEREALQGSRLTQLCLRYGVAMPEKGWRPVERYGEIHGIHRIRGLCIATNGILCIIVDGNGKIFVAHWDWFVKDKDLSEPTETKRRSKIEKLLELYD